jgi:Leucine-rich repeat (LRR) protein
MSYPFSNCPQLKEIMYLPSSLSRFELRNCKSLKFLPSRVPSLSVLILEGVGLNIIRWVQNLTSLTSLFLINIPKLRFITSAYLSCAILPSLKKLDISCCANLQLFCHHGLPCQIAELYLKDLKSLNSLPSGLDLLPQLHTLEIHDLPGLSSVSMMPPSLRFLSINKCFDLERRCDIGGPDWLNVSNVSCLLIGGTQLR